MTKMALAQQLSQDALTVAIEEHSMSVQHLLEEAFPDQPELIAIYTERVAPAWSDFVAELLGRATSMSASAVLALQQSNDARLNDHEERITALENKPDALADDR